MPILKPHQNEQILRFQGTRLRFRFRPGTGDTLLIRFHGAMKRDLRRVPQYTGFLPLCCPQISLADPGMELHPTLASSWYLGDRTQNLLSVLPAFFDAVAAEAGTKRKIFVGGSAGGFAALPYAHKSGEDALAIASSPQINLEKYSIPSAVENFRSLCDPEAASIAALAE